MVHVLVHLHVPVIHTVCSLYMHTVNGTFHRVLLVGTTKLNWPSTAHRLMLLRDLVENMESKRIIRTRCGVQYV